MFDSIEDLIEDIRCGKMVLLVDDEDRENEGDLVLAADHVSAEKINFMVTEARGLVCLSLPAEQIERLRLPMMVREEQNHSPNKTAFTVSIEAALGVSTGISAADRAHTIRVASNPESQPQDVIMPGHIFPIRAQSGGVLRRAGHTEGSLDLAKLAGLRPAAVICEVMNPDGSMARVKELKEFARRHQLKIGTIVDLIAYRLHHDSLVEEVGETQAPFLGEDYRVRVFRSKLDQLEHLVIQKGDPYRGDATLVRVHLDDYFRDFLTTMKGGGRHPLMSVVEKFQQEPSAVLLILRSRAIVRSILQLLEDKGAVSMPAGGMDDRDYGIGAQILRHLGVRQIRLISSRPEKRVGLKAYGLEITEYVHLEDDDEEKDKSQDKSQT